MSSSQQFDLDGVLGEIGVFSSFQIKNYILLAFPILASSIYTLTYLFTAANPQYRCLIPECEDLSNTTYNPEWLQNAIPFKNDLPRKCERYPYWDNNNNTNPEVCPVTAFNQQAEVECNEFFINSDHTSILNDFNLFCEERWKLGLPGSIHNVGQFCSMLFTGIISDKFGRRVAITLGVVSSAVFGLLRSYSPSFIWFLIWEFLDATLGSGAFISSFVLATELVVPSKRSLVSVIVWEAFPVGEMTLGFVAWQIHDWREMLRYLYAPGLLFVAYLWIIPESVRWLISKGRYEEADKILLKAASNSGVTLSLMNLNKMEVLPASYLEKSIERLDEKQVEKSYPIKVALKNRKLLMRLVILSLCWVICVFINYGLSLNSVSISEHTHINFIAVAAMAIPGNMMCYFLIDKLGRKRTMCGGFLVTGLACICIMLGDQGISHLKLIGYLVGKGVITMTFGVLYIFTAELFPTPLRHTLFGTCSMFGRIGSIVAPQMAYLAESVWILLPTLLFGSTSLIGVALGLFLPETLNAKLPDTIEEALELGRKK